MIVRDRHEHRTFRDYPDQVDATQNESTEKLRRNVIQPKITNSYRAVWAAQAETDASTKVNAETQNFVVATQP